MFESEGDSNGCIWVQFCVHLQLFFEHKLAISTPPDVTKHPMNLYRVPDEYFSYEIPIDIDAALMNDTVMEIDDDLKFAIPIKIPCE